MYGSRYTLKKIREGRILFFLKLFFLEYIQIGLEMSLLKDKTDIKGSNLVLTLLLPLHRNLDFCFRWSFRYEHVFFFLQILK